MGEVWEIEDETVRLPAPPSAQAGERTMHARRRVIVMQANRFNEATRPPTVLVIPCSGSTNPNGYDFTIPQGEEAFTAVQPVALVSLLQPILKQELLTLKGTLSAHALGQLRAQVQLTLGLSEPLTGSSPPPILPPRVG